MFLLKNLPAAQDRLYCAPHKSYLDSRHGSHLSRRTAWNNNAGGALPHSDAATTPSSFIRVERFLTVCRHRMEKKQTERGGPLLTHLTQKDSELLLSPT